jgi:non-ribosomal peptide synthetase component F
MFMTLLAAFKAFLYACTGQEDILVGSPFGNRTRTETEGLIGAFVNTVVLRTRLAGDLPFQDLLGRVRETVFGADAHQDLPFEKVVEVLRPPRDPSRNPLFQVNFRFVTGSPLVLKLPGITSTLKFGETVNSKFDLALELWLDAGEFGGYFEYSSDLFEEATARRMATDFEQLLGAVLAHPDTPLSGLEPLARVAGARRTTAATARDLPRVKGLREVRRKGVDVSQFPTGPEG